MNEKTRVLLADAADEFRHMAAEMIQQEADMAVSYTHLTLPTILLV